MESITLGAIADSIGMIAGIITGLGVMYALLWKWLHSMFKKQTETIEKEIRSLHDRIETSDMENCKNFLTRCLADLERGEYLTDTEEQRFWEEYGHYIENGGNHYIAEKTEMMKREGRIAHLHSH